MSIEHELQGTIRDLVQKGKGILAADESLPTIAKRFKAVGVESTEENRRAYRSLMLTAPGVGEYLSGVILFEETLGQKADDGTSLPKAAERPGNRARREGGQRNGCARQCTGRSDHPGSRRPGGAIEDLQDTRCTLRQVARGVSDYRPQSNDARNRGQRRGARALREPHARSRGLCLS